MEIKSEKPCGERHYSVVVGFVGARACQTEVNNCIYYYIISIEYIYNRIDVKMEGIVTKRHYVSIDG